MNPYQDYQKQAIETMTGGEMIVALYDGAIKNLNLALVHIDQRDINHSHQSLVKAQDIIRYLDCTLNDDMEMSANLHQLYDFFINELVQANMKKDKQRIEPLIPMIKELRDAFHQADKLTRMR